MLRTPYNVRAKTFEHQPIQYVELVCEDTPNGRFYTMPDGVTKFRSMTSMLGLTSDKTWLEKWRERIGHEAAEAETKRCTERGEAVHLSCEWYLKNYDMEKVLSASSSHTKLFAQIKHWLDTKVGTVLAQEIPLFSYKMKLAGRVDLVCYWFHEGRWKLAIVDYKTSNWFKAPTDIEDYQTQLCGYAVMLYEMTGLRAELLVNVIGTETRTVANVAYFTPAESLPILQRRVKQFWELLDNQ